MVTIRELNAGDHVAGMAVARNGEVWLATLNYGNGPSGVIRMHANGLVQRFSRPESFNRVAVDARGVAWLTVGAGSSGQPPKLVRIDGSGRMREYPLPVEGNFQGITIGPDGAPWFVDAAASAIGRMGSNGITYYGPASVDPTEIVANHVDGNLWFTEPAGNLIGRLNPNGSLKEFRLPTSGAHPTGITSDMRGNIWFCESAVNKIGRITPTGSIAELDVATHDAWPAAIAVARDGSLWFTELLTQKVGRIQTDARAPKGWTITEYGLSGNGYPGPIVAAPDGRLWIASNAKRDAVIGLIASRSRLMEFSP